MNGMLAMFSVLFTSLIGTILTMLGGLIGSAYLRRASAKTTAIVAVASSGVMFVHFGLFRYSERYNWTFSQFSPDVYSLLLAAFVVIPPIGILMNPESE